MADEMLEELVVQLQVTYEQFIEQLKIGLQIENDRKIFEQIIIVDNFLVFKKIMVNRNKQLELEVLKNFQKNEQKSSESIQNELKQKEIELQEKEIEQAIAMSITIEKDRKKLLEQEQKELEEALKQSKFDYDKEQNEWYQNQIKILEEQTKKQSSDEKKQLEEQKKQLEKQKKLEKKQLKEEKKKPKEESKKQISVVNPQKNMDLDDLMKERLALKQKMSEMKSQQNQENLKQKEEDLLERKKRLAQQRDLLVQKKKMEREKELEKYKSMQGTNPSIIGELDKRSVFELSKEREEERLKSKLLLEKIKADLDNY